MKLARAGLAAAAAAGLTVLSATPAMAVGLPFENCDQAAAVGVYNIPAGTPGYQQGLDADNDGTGCDAAGTPAYNANIVATIVAQNNQQPTQVKEMPVGGADTGVANVGLAQQNDDGAEVLALGGGLILAVVGATILIRRRHAA